MLCAFFLSSSLALSLTLFYSISSSRIASMLFPPTPFVVRPTSLSLSSFYLLVPKRGLFQLCGGRSQRRRLSSLSRLFRANDLFCGISCCPSCVFEQSIYLRLALPSLNCRELWKQGYTGTDPLSHPIKLLLEMGGDLVIQDSTDKVVWSLGVKSPCPEGFSATSSSPPGATNSPAGRNGAGAGSTTISYTRATATTSVTSPHVTSAIASSAARVTHNTATTTTATAVHKPAATTPPFARP